MHVSPVQQRALFLADGLRDYIWVLGTNPSREFEEQMRQVVQDKVDRLLEALGQ
jgi:hypothetical protein